MSKRHKPSRNKENCLFHKKKKKIHKTKSKRLSLFIHTIVRLRVSESFFFVLVSYNLSSLDWKKGKKNNHPAELKLTCFFFWGGEAKETAT